MKSKLTEKMITTALESGIDHVLDLIDVENIKKLGNVKVISNMEDSAFSIFIVICTFIISFFFYHKVFETISFNYNTRVSVVKTEDGLIFCEHEKLAGKIII